MTRTSVLMRLMRLCAYTLVRLCSYERSPIASSSAITIDHHCNYTSAGGVSSMFRTATLRKIKKEQDMLNIDSHAELLNASKRQRLTDNMSLMYRNTILVTLASEEHYQLKCRFIEKHAKHSLRLKPGESIHPLHDARRRIWVEDESVTRTQSHEGCKHKLIILLSN